MNHINTREGAKVGRSSCPCTPGCNSRDFLAHLSNGGSRHSIHLVRVRLHLARQYHRSFLFIPAYFYFDIIGVSTRNVIGRTTVAAAWLGWGLVLSLPAPSNGLASHLKRWWPLVDTASNTIKIASVSSSLEISFFFWIFVRNRIVIESRGSEYGRKWFV